MAKFKVILEFEYDSEQSTDDWQGEMPHEFITNADEAIETAIAELESNSPHEFVFNVYDEDGEFIKSN